MAVSTLSMAIGYTIRFASYLLTILIGTLLVVFADEAIGIGFWMLISGINLLTSAAIIIFVEILLPILCQGVGGIKFVPGVLSASFLVPRASFRQLASDVEVQVYMRFGNMNDDQIRMLFPVLQIEMSEVELNLTSLLAPQERLVRENGEISSVNSPSQPARENKRKKKKQKQKQKKPRKLINIFMFFPVFIMSNVLLNSIMMIIRSANIIVHGVKIRNIEKNLTMQIGKFETETVVRGWFSYEYRISTGEVWVQVEKENGIRIRMGSTKILVGYNPVFKSNFVPRPLGLLDHVDINIVFPGMAFRMGPIFSKLGAIKLDVYPGLRKELIEREPGWARTKRLHHRVLFLPCYWFVSMTLYGFELLVQPHQDRKRPALLMAQIEEISALSYGAARRVLCIHNELEICNVFIRDSKSFLPDKLLSDILHQKNYDKALFGLRDVHPSALILLQLFGIQHDISEEQPQARIWAGTSGFLAAVDTFALAGLFKDLKSALLGVIPEKTKRPEPAAVPVGGEDTTRVVDHNVALPVASEMNAVSPRGRADTPTLTSSSVANPPKGAGSPPAPDIVISIELSKTCFLVHGETYMGDVDTAGFFLFLQTTRGTEVIFNGNAFHNATLCLRNVYVYHIMRKSAPCHVRWSLLSVNVDAAKKIRLALTNPRLLWSLDLQAGIQAVKYLVEPLQALKPPASASVPIPASSYVAAAPSPSPAAPSSGMGTAEASVPPAKPKPKSTAWKTIEVMVESLKFHLRFFDGTSCTVYFGVVGPFQVGDPWWPCNDLVYIVQEVPLGYVKTFRYANPIPEKFPLDIINHPLVVKFEMEGTRLLLPRDYHYGNSWASFMMRLKTFMQDMKAKRVAAGFPKKPKIFPQLFIKAVDSLATIEDSKLNAFLTKTAPLLQDECNERLKRTAVFNQRLNLLDPRILDQYGDDLLAMIFEQDSVIYKYRHDSLLREYPAISPGPCFADLDAPPLAALRIGDGDYSLFRNEEMIAQHGVYNGKRMAALDGCVTTIPGKNDNSSYVERGFRKMKLVLYDVALHLRDFKDDCIYVNEWSADGEVGMILPDSNPPYGVTVEFAMGSKLMGKMGRGLHPVKLYWDLDVLLKGAHINWNHSIFPVFLDFTRQPIRFGPDSKDPSNKQPWFDMIRLIMHGRVRFRFQNLTARLGAVPSPYATLRHYIDLSSDEAVLLLSKLETPTSAPVLMRFEGLKLVPTIFQPDQKTEIFINRFEINMFPIYYCKDGWDPTNHYVVPFRDPQLPSSTYYTVVKVDDMPHHLLESNRTKWIHWTQHLPTDHDTYDKFRSRKIDLNLDVSIDFRNQRGTIYSDGLSTIMNVALMFASKNPTFKPPPKVKPLRGKPPASETLGMLLNKFNVNLAVRQLNLDLWNNLEPENGLHVKVDSIGFTLSTVRTDPFPAPMKLSCRCAEIHEVDVDISLPKMDVGTYDNFPNRGFLLKAKKIEVVTIMDENHLKKSGTKRGLSTSANESIMRRASAGTSPFHGFTPADNYGRGNRLEQDQFRNNVVIQELRLFWSPERRDAIFDWPPVFAVRNVVLEGHHKFSPASSQSGDQDVESQRLVPSLVQAGASLRPLLQEIKTEEQLAFVQPFNPSEGGTQRILERNPIALVNVNDVQVLFQSSEMTSLAILTSKEMNTNVVNKKIADQDESWDETEINLSLEGAEIYSLVKYLDAFDYGRTWVPLDAAAILSSGSRVRSKFEKVTDHPFYLDMCYVAPAAVEYTDDHTSARPTKLLINVPDLSIVSTSPQFRTVFDVVTKIMMKRAPFNYQVQQELSNLKYGLQLAGIENPRRNDLMAYANQIKNVVRLFDYSVDTGMYEYVSQYMKLESSDVSVYDVRRRYIAKLRALLTYIKKEHNVTAGSELYPSMYLSYSFDLWSWKLKHTNGQDDRPFLELRLEELVCRHIFYVGKVSSQEFTFEDIEIKNLHSENSRVLSTDMSMKGQREFSNIKSSDGSPVAFRWNASQSERVGGIPVFENLVLHILPITASLSNRLIRSMQLFLFGEAEDERNVVASGHRQEDDEIVDLSSQSDTVPSHSNSVSTIGTNRRIETGGSVESISHGMSQTTNNSVAMSGGGGLGVVSGSLKGVLSLAPQLSSTRELHLNTMRERAETSIFFKYIYIGEVQLTVSFRMKEESKGKGFLDFKNLVIAAPSTMYNSKVWSWKEFFDQVKHDVLIKAIKVGVNNLTKQKLLGIRSAKAAIANRAHRVIDRRRDGAAAASSGLKTITSVSGFHRPTRNVDIVTPQVSEERQKEREKVMTQKECMDIFYQNPDEIPEQSRRDATINFLFGAYGTK